jgi:hypothetical protein
MIWCICAASATTLSPRVAMRCEISMVDGSVARIDVLNDRGVAPTLLLASAARKNEDLLHELLALRRA